MPSCWTRYPRRMGIRPPVAMLSEEAEPWSGTLRSLRSTETTYPCFTVILRQTSPERSFGDSEMWAESQMPSTAGSSRSWGRGWLCSSEIEAASQSKFDR